MSAFGVLLSVNAGPAAPMTVHGETIVTGFDKRPTGAAARIEVDGLVGDAHVDDAHDLDRAVLFYQRGHYEFWSRELGRQLAPGTFGEQFTIDGPCEDEIVVGDRLRIGGLVLDVTQPRIPCRKMAVRLGREDMPRLFLRSGRVGFFARVVQPGQVRVGDEIELVRRGPDGITVAELADVLHRDEPDLGALERILSASVLPELVRAKLTELQRRMLASGGSWTGDWSLVVTGRRTHGSDVVSIDLAAGDGRRLPDFQAGQFLTLSLEIPGMERPVVRTYTVAGRSADGAGYRLGVRRERPPDGDSDLPPGVASGYLHDSALVGTRLNARAPRGRFVLRSGDRPVVLASAGIGITPMLAMLEELVRAGTRREVHFVHGARSSRELAFGREVRALVATSPRVHSHLLFSRPQPHDQLGRDYDRAGRLTVDVLEDLVPGLDGDFYVCGPVPFMADVVSGLLAVGVPEEQVRHEFFGTAASLFGDDPAGDVGREATDGEGRPILVTFARSGVTVPWRENSFSLLSLAERSGLRPAASCRTGLCNTCVCRLDSGEIEYVIEPMDPVTAGKVAVCCARPRTSVMIDL
jgi:ferredoxin-NADP reductase/MOSC domain-containing protein YiiM